MTKHKLPEGWKIMKLMDISEDISAGGTPSRTRKEYWENGTIPWLKIADMKSVYITKTEEKITNKGLENSSAKLFSKGTLVYSIFASLGTIGILDIDASTNQAIACINPKKDIITTKYLYYCLQSEKNRILSKKSHATQDNLNLTILRNHEIPVPPLDIQKKIVSILEQAEALKQKREQADKLTEDYLKSVFYEMFLKRKFPRKKLEDVCDKITDGSHRTPQLLKEGFPFLTVMNMEETGFDYSDCKKISEKDFNDLVKNDCQPKKGDVLFSKDGTVGKVMRIEETKEDVILSSIAILRPKKDINQIYLQHILKTDFVLNQAVERKSGSALRRIILKQLKQVEIPVPPQPLQEKFSSMIKYVEKLKEKQKKNKEQINELFNSLMQKAFTGELVT